MQDNIKTRRKFLTVTLLELWWFENQKDKFDEDTALAMTMIPAWVAVTAGKQQVYISREM